MIYMHKIIPMLLSPLILCLTIILIGAVTQKRLPIISAILILVSLSMPISAIFLFKLIEYDSMKRSSIVAQSASAVVVLSGMLHEVNTDKGIEYEWSDPDRFFAGVQLLKDHQAPILIFTGGKLPWEKGLISEGAYLKQTAVNFGINENTILVTENVENTYQEAHAIYNLLSIGKPRIILVTSAFHMRRAKYIFEKEGFDVIPYTVDFQSMPSKLKPMDFLPQAWALETSSLAIREAIGYLYYFLKDHVGMWSFAGL